MSIQYLGFQLKARGREYAYRVIAPKVDPREFTLTISNQAFSEKHVLYQDAAALCYQKLQRELATETEANPLQRHFTVSDQDLNVYREKHRPARRRSS
jgi:hypothetical protein